VMTWGQDFQLRHVYLTCPIAPILSLLGTVSP
jgi:hypothetical protein